MSLVIVTTLFSILPGAGSLQLEHVTASNSSLVIMLFVNAINARAIRLYVGNNWVSRVTLPASLVDFRPTDVGVTYLCYTFCGDIDLTKDD